MWEIVVGKTVVGIAVVGIAIVGIADDGIAIVQTLGNEMPIRGSPKLGGP